MMEWMLMPLRRYADFSGRSRRKEYWFYTLGVTLVGLLLVIAMFTVAGGTQGLAGGADVFAGPFAIVILLFGLALFIPSLAVQVRRFHDQDKSGWFVLLNFIPYIGGLIVLVFMLLEGTRGPNRFGEDPKAVGDIGGV